MISLDYDLGDDERSIGYDVLVGMLDAVQERGLILPEIRIHSADRLGRLKTQMRADAIMLLQPTTTYLDCNANEYG